MNAAIAPTAPTGPATAEPVLKAQGLTKRFGGLAAVNDVSLALHKGHLHAVIGPNGAGKSTLTNLLTGDLAPTAGRVWLKGTEVTGWSNVRLSQAGLGRSFQKTNVLLPFTVWDNVRLAAQSRSRHSPFNPLQWLTRAGTDAAERERTQAAIERAHLSARTHAVAATISHGEQRQLEVAMALATQPQVLLLDEPLAGMGAAEAERMVAVLQSLKAQHAILLVEHDMDAVFALADELTVMVNGQVIASGTPAAVRADAAVQAAYLGEDETDVSAPGHAA